MTISHIKALLDSFYLAKRTRELLPPLPKGITSAHIQYLDVIESLEKAGHCVKISDISDALALPRPGVTRTVKEMEAKGLLEKTVSEEDGRVTYLTATPAGKALSATFDGQFFHALAPLLEGISDQDAETTIRTIETMYAVMAERSIHLDWK